MQDGLQNLLFFANSRQPPASSQSCFPKLSWHQRLLGFLICFILGYFIQLLAVGSFLSLVTGSPAKFAIIYSFGNVLVLMGTGFLIGFKKQIENMADPERRYTSIIFVGALIGTMVSSLFFHSKLLVLLFLIIQIPAFIWYTATYIPFAREFLISCLGGIRDAIIRRRG